ncbi:MAG TPA: 6,7-dimethyl-8-ribityllumazine synthase [Gaiellaceae bacterium]|nr:6,7-dimethyl-8-ribityllumazine synthase [Gaiellaceae bacterium]
MRERRERLERLEVDEEERLRFDEPPQAADEERDGDGDGARLDGDDAWPAEIDEQEHAAGELDVPDDVAVLRGEARGGRRTVGIVVSRFNGDVTNRLLQRALEELEDAGVPPAMVTVMPVPGAFELPLAAMALAKTRRFACVVALGCVVRGETPHFDYVAGEAASGLQLAALETGVPVSFGVLTVETVEQAEARIERAADAVRSGLEMADVFAQLRRAAASQG